MIALGKRIGICLLIAGLVCFAACLPASAAPDETAENRVEVIGPSGHGGGATQQATTIVTAVIKAPEDPDNPDKPDPVNPDNPDQPTTGDNSNLTMYRILLSVAAAGIIITTVLLVKQRKKE